MSATSDSLAGNVDGAVNASNNTQTIPLGSNIAVRGWGAELEQSPGAPVSRVEVDIDGQFLGYATLGIARPDVATAYSHSDLTNSGWSFTGPVNNVAPGEHTIAARIYGKDGASLAEGGTLQVIIAGTMPPLSGPSSTLKYSYSLAYDAAGNVINASDPVNGSWAYSYDSLNRLISGSSSSTGLAWSYDAFGNRRQQTATLGAAPQPEASFRTATNRIDGICYDASGNILNDGPCTGVQKYAYDADGKMLSSNFGQTSYLYDADGHRVAKYDSGNLTNSISTTLPATWSSSSTATSPSCGRSCTPKAGTLPQSRRGHCSSPTPAGWARKQHAATPTALSAKQSQPYPSETTPPAPAPAHPATCSSPARKETQKHGSTTSALDTIPRKRVGSCRQIQAACSTPILPIHKA